MNYTRECKSNVYSSDDDMVAIIQSNTLQIGPKKHDSTNCKHKSGPLHCLWRCLQYPERFTNFRNHQHFIPRTWLTTAPTKDLQTFANESIAVIGLMQTPVEGNGWRIADAELPPKTTHWQRPV